VKNDVPIIVVVVLIGLFVGTHPTEANECLEIARQLARSDVLLD